MSELAQRREQDEALASSLVTAAAVPMPTINKRGTDG